MLIKCRLTLKLRLQSLLVEEKAACGSQASYSRKTVLLSPPRLKSYPRNKQQSRSSSLFPSHISQINVC